MGMLLIKVIPKLKFWRWDVYLWLYVCNYLFVNYLFVLIVFSSYWQSAGIKFPPREENSVPLFTHLQTQSISHSAPAYEDATIPASTESDPSDLRYIFTLTFLRNMERY